MFIRSNLLKDHTAATEIKKIDLPTNPLSHLVIALDGYNATDEATLAEILAFINKIEVTHLGKTIISLESEDLTGLMAYLYGRGPVLTQSIGTDNSARTLGLIVPFGRKIFDPSECFPKTQRGELILSIDYTAPATSFDNSTLNVEAVEMPEAQPSQYLKSTMLTVTAPGATGDNNVSLPIGNDIACVAIRMTTFPTTSSHTYGVDLAKILVDNIEHGYSSARAQALVADGIFHNANVIRTIAAQGNIIPLNTVYLDYDPAKDDKHLLQTAGKSSVVLRATMGVDEATYVSVYELVKI